MKMSIGDDYYEGIYFHKDEKYGNYDVPEELANQWLEAEAKYREAQDQAILFAKNNK